MSEIETLRERVRELEREAEDHNALIELQHKRVAEADREWQAATGRHNTYPDLGELVEWLRGERDRAFKLARRLIRECDDARRGRREVKIQGKRGAVAYDEGEMDG